MGRRKTRVPLNVFLNSRLVGQLSRETSGAIDFRYDADWLAWEHALPISLSMPLREDRYIGDPVIAVFDNLLPDTDHIRRRVAEKKGAQGTDAFSLLSVIGRDCVGALQFLPDGEDPDPVGSLDSEPLSDDAVSDLIAGLEQSPLGMDREDDFRISVAGAQEKTALLFKDGHWHKPKGTTPTTHILKPQMGQLPFGVDLSNSVENEYLCLKLLEAFGLKVAQTEMADFGERRVLTVERFDRRWTKDGRLIRLPQEDFCQALSYPSTLKYQNEGGPGIVQILELLKASDAVETDQADFLKAQILFWLISATDGHAKNFSVFLTPGGRFRMTPLYDVISVQPSFDAGQMQRRAMKMAMSVGTRPHYRVDQIALRHFNETAERAGVAHATAERVFEEIASNADDAFQKTEDALPKAFPVEIVESLSKTLREKIAYFPKV